MPIYGFECGSCGHRFDRLQKLSDPDPTVCPDCGAEQLRRQLTAPSFRLSGSGWYETDFKKDGDKKRNLVEGSSGGGTSESKGDSKPVESKSTDAKPSESKSSESKSSESRPAPKADSAPAVKPAAD